MILIVSSEDDVHAVAVRRELARLGASAVVLDLSTVPRQRALSFHFVDQRRTFCLNGSSGGIRLSDARVIWWRRPQHVGLHAEISNPQYRQFAHTETYEAMAGMWNALDARWINPPTNDERAHRKVYQLRVAQEVGLTVPETLVTSDPDAARAFIGHLGIGHTAYKAFSATPELWRETRLLRANETDLLDNVRFAPVIFQQYVPAAHDLRITVVDTEIFAAAVYSQETSYKVDMRMDIANARIVATDLPAEIRERIHALMQRLGLVYGAIDMRQTPDGEHVFLEINPAGQWLFVEERTGQPIAAAMAEVMARWSADWGQHVTNR